jgi:hypothetical protein
MQPKRIITNKIPALKTLLKTFVFFLFAVVLNTSVQAQNGRGCTDKSAKNYDVSAVVNDGSCQYKPVVYNPPFKYLLPEKVKETSGLIYYDNALWTINDSGNPAVLYRLDPLTGSVTGSIKVSNAENHDWEALAQDKDYIYIGDFGNNKGNRNDLQIIKIAKKDLPASGNGQVEATFIWFSYPDYPGHIDKRKNNNFDCESMICVGDSLYLFSKNWQNSRTRLYSLPVKEGEYSARLLDEFNSRGLITGADYNENTKEITLVGYTNKTWLPFLWLLSDFKDQHFFSGNKRRIDMLNIPATQTEGIAYTNGRQCVITSEGRKIFTQTAYGLNTEKWLGENDTAETATPEITAVPNPMNGKYLFIEINHAVKGTYTVKLISENGELAGTKNIHVKHEDRPANTKFRITRLKPGNYQVQVTSGTQVYDLKCIKP